MILGSHVKMAADLYLEGSVKEALGYGANAMMIYTGAPQNTKRIPVERLHIQEAHQLMQDHGISAEHLIIHAPYIINPANSVKPEVAELAVEFLEKEIQRTKAVGSKYIVLHPGSYTTTDMETGIRTIIRQLNSIRDIPEGIMICLETMAGKGSEVGYRFEQLAEIYDGLELKEHYAVCFDTCHTHDAGYDLTDLDSVLDEFDHYLGMDKMKVIHLNDSKNIRGARKDRHANLGQGMIGFDTLYNVCTHPRLAKIPKILETPYIDGKPPYKEEIEMLKNGAYDPEVLKNA
ncbi:MAG: deoxyribonuclease IV [Solobacterium sp.]|nr:deoxyribonuclease IV [Solobacterium sp.]